MCATELDEPMVNEARVRSRSFELGPQRGEVGWHLLAGRSGDDERDEYAADAVTFEVDGDGDGRVVGVDGFHGDVDDGADRSVDASHATRSRRVDVDEF